MKFEKLNDPEETEIEILNELSSPMASHQNHEIFLSKSPNQTRYSTKLFDKVDLEFVHGQLYNEDGCVLVNLNDEYLQNTNKTSRELIAAGGDSLLDDTRHAMEQRQHKPLLKGSVIEATVTGNLRCQVLLHSISLVDDLKPLSTDALAKQI